MGQSNAERAYCLMSPETFERMMDAVESGDLGQFLTIVGMNVEGDMVIEQQNPFV